MTLLDIIGGIGMLLLFLGLLTGAGLPENEPPEKDDEK